jgi:hypothetical protein
LLYMRCRTFYFLHLFFLSSNSNSFLILILWISILWHINSSCLTFVHAVTGKQR